MLGEVKHILLTRLTGELALALSRTFVVRGLGAVGTLLLTVVLGRLYGPVGVGAFAIAHSIALGAAIVARAGMDQALVRFVGRNREAPEVLAYFSRAFKKALLISVGVAVAIYINRDFLEGVFGSKNLSSLLTGIAVAIPAFTLSFVISGFLKGVRKPAAASFLENGSISLVATLLLLLLNWIHYDAGVRNASVAFAIAAWLVLLFGGWQIRAWCAGRKNAAYKRTSSLGNKEFSSSSRAFFVLSLASFMRSALGILIAGYFLDTSELGLFRTAQQTALMISFVLVVINAIYPARFATLYHNGKMNELGRLSRHGALIGVIISSPLFLICLIAPHIPLAIFGDTFLGAATLLRVLAIAHFINVATGSAGYLLSMSGYEKLMKNIGLFTSAMGILLFSFLSPTLGALGATIALAMILAAHKIIATIFVWRRMELCVLPCPHILKYIVG